MKVVLVFGAVILSSVAISGCDSGIAAGASVVGVWDCHMRTESGPSKSDLSDTKTFNDKGQYSSSRAPEGKVFKYRLEGNKLIFSYPYGDWTENVTRLTNDALEFSNDKSGAAVKTSCTRSKK